MDSGVAIWMPSPRIYKNLLSKMAQLKIAHRVGFDTLPTYLIDENADTTSLIPAHHFPLCLRPDDPKAVSPSFKVKLAMSPEDLVLWFRKLEKVDQPILAQPFVNLPNLVVHGARTLSGRAIGLQAFLVERKYRGVTLIIRPTDLEEKLRRKCIEFVEFFQLTGNYHFEFLLDRVSDKKYFLELNGRLGGTTAKVCACGYDEPLLLLEAYGVCKGFRQEIRNYVVSSKHGLLRYCRDAIQAKLTPMDYPIENNILRVLKGAYGIFCYRDEILTIRDVPGSIAFIKSLLKSADYT
jgi:hypothetical protein